MSPRCGEVWSSSYSAPAPSAAVGGPAASEAELKGVSTETAHLGVGDGEHEGIWSLEPGLAPRQARYQRHHQDRALPRFPFPAFLRFSCPWIFCDLVFLICLGVCSTTLLPFQFL